MKNKRSNDSILEFYYVYIITTVGCFYKLHCLPYFEKLVYELVSKLVCKRLPSGYLCNLLTFYTKQCYRDGKPSSIHPTPGNDQGVKDPDRIHDKDQTPKDSVSHEGMTTGVLRV